MDGIRGEGFEALPDFVSALAIGLLIGLEREGRVVAGVASFPAPAPAADPLPAPPARAGSASAASPGSHAARLAGRVGAIGREFVSIRRGE